MAFWLGLGEMTMALPAAVTGARLKRTDNGSQGSIHFRELVERDPLNMHCLGGHLAASRAFIHAFLADHVGETVAAFGRAIVTGGNAVFSALVQMMTHGVFP